MENTTGTFSQSSARYRNIISRDLAPMVTITPADADYILPSGATSRLFRTAARQSEIDQGSRTGGNDQTAQTRIA
jgi:hypothetical protein